MNYTVLWRQRAENELIRMWDAAGEPQDLAETADAVNRWLRDSAHELGESRDRPTRRLWFQRPLCVAFEIDAAALVVYVVAVKWVGY